jgi:NADPH:quinone reductase-like Zn-dependent oxidoreductase
METIPKTMRALVQLEDGYSGKSEGPAISDAALYLAEAEIPAPTPEKGQVLIKLRIASVNPSDLHFIKGEYGQPRRKGAERLIGKRVAFAVSLGGSGAWAEYALTDAVACIPLRSDVSDVNGSAQIVNPLTAMAMVDIAAKDGDAFVISAATSQLG